MLRLDLAEIMRTVGMNQTYVLNEPPYKEDDVTYLTPVRGSVTVTNGGSVLLARGSFETTVELECARCLTSVPIPIAAEIEEQFSLSEVESGVYRDVTPEVIQDEEHELLHGLFEGKVMNLAVLIRQAAILESPLNPLCREECAGLCPSCGSDLNNGSCQCAPRTASTPLSALGQLLRERESRN